MAPAIAIITPNSLAALGLQRILSDSFPACTIHAFSSFADFSELKKVTGFMHYFVDALEVMQGAQFFLQHQRATIILIRGEHDSTVVPQGFRTLNIFQPLRDLTMALAQMSQTGHRKRPVDDRLPGEHTVQAAQMASTLPNANPLTPRECEVMQGIVRGKINKEIAAAMGINPTTVITHRKNITAKLGLKSVSALTVYALMHGIVGIEEVENNL